MIEQRINTSKIDAERYNTLMLNFGRSYTNAVSSVGDEENQVQVLRQLLAEASTIQLEFNAFFDEEIKKNLTDLRNISIEKISAGIIRPYCENEGFDYSPKMLHDAKIAIFEYSDELISSVKRVHYKQHDNQGVY
jgi:hypothetical protein